MFIGGFEGETGLRDGVGSSERFVVRDAFHAWVGWRHVS